MTRLVSPIAIEFAMRARAAAILRSRAADRVQPHSRKLPTNEELAEARFAARQFEAAADDLAAGLLVDDARAAEGG